MKMYLKQLKAKLLLSTRKICQIVGAASFCIFMIIVMIKLIYRNDRYPYQSPSRMYDELEIPGLGDMGEEAIITTNTTESNEYFYNVWISKRISLRRRLPEMADERCSTDSLNISDLPKVSIIMTYRNEHPTVFLRALYSIFKWSPEHLIADVILVEDDNVKAFLHHASYTVLLNKHFGDKIRHLRFDKYSFGAKKASHFGAKRAKGQILIFLNAAIEVASNWLPPLILPIINDSKIVTLPSLDSIDSNSFKYSINVNDLSGFDWALNHTVLPLNRKQHLRYPAPYQNPLMTEPIFAINAKWYYEMVVYDKGLKRSEAETYEWSFRIWMCGGQILQVPCSRIGVIKKNLTYTDKKQKNILKDQRRVVQVWFDEYKDLVYENRPILKSYNSGPIRIQKLFRENCKSFNWFLTHIMSDFFQVPSIENFGPNTTHGALRSLGNTSLCLSSKHNYMSDDGLASLKLSVCPSDLKKLPHVFKWILSDRQQILQGFFCLTVNLNRPVADLLMTLCHKVEKNSWHYDKRTQMLEFVITEDETKLCFEGDLQILDAFANTCDFNNPNQHWVFERD